MAERITGDAEQRLHERQRALLAEMFVSLPDDDVPRVVLLAEGTDPHVAPESAFHESVRRLGFELHPDTIGSIARMRERGLIPCLTLIDGWINVFGVRPERCALSPGGDA